MASYPGNGRGKHVEFGPQQRHSRNFELGMIVFCILCIVVAVIIGKARSWGITTRP